jgi:pyridoxal phosphate enzyme (YggS family)
MTSIKQNVSQILAELPEGVQLVAAAKTRTPEEIQEAVEAGAGIIGENYVQEAERAFEVIGGRAQWHFIGHLQTNKVKKAVPIFDMIETVDSAELAREIDKRCAQAGKTMPVLIEVNSGREAQKAGVLPEDTEVLVREIADPEDSRPYFVETKKIFEKLKRLELPNIEMKYLSMGMTNSYKVALEEGANMVRIGTKIFGEREYQR